jgi:hypothetical protein
MTDDRTCSLCGRENNQSITMIPPDLNLCRDCSDKLHAWQRALDDEITAARGGPTPMRCPRRDESPIPDAYIPEDRSPDQPDDWRIIDGQLRCTYCGSLHPDTFMERARNGEEVGPTDKSYKAYLDNPWAKFYFQHLSPEQRRAFIDMLNVKNGHADLAPEGTPAMNIGYPGRFYTEPFFMVRRAS